MARKKRKYSLGYAAEMSGSLVGVLFLVKAFELISGLSLARLGIWPRTPEGLIGILCSPLLHGNVAHLLANAGSLFILLTVLYWDRQNYPEQTLGIVWVISGIGTWLVGRGGAYHIGASGIVFGLAAYLIATGFWRRDWRSLFVSLAVFFLFGGIFYGALPREGPISWEGHLCGTLAGIWAAWRNHR